MQLLRDISTCGATAGVFAQPRSLLGLKSDISRGPSCATNGHSMGRLEGSVHPPPAKAVLLGRMKRGSSQIMTPLASAEAELQSDRAALLRLRSDRGCGRVGCEQFCSDSGRTKA